MLHFANLFLYIALNMCHDFLRHLSHKCCYFYLESMVLDLH